MIAHACRQCKKDDDKITIFVRKKVHESNMSFYQCFLNVFTNNLFSFLQAKMLYKPRSYQNEHDNKVIYCKIVVECVVLTY